MKTTDLIVLLFLAGPPIIAWLLVPKPKTRYERSVRAKRWFMGAAALYMYVGLSIVCLCVMLLFLNQAWKPLGALAVLGVYFYSIKV